MILQKHQCVILSSTPPPHTGRSDNLSTAPNKFLPTWHSTSRHVAHFPSLYLHILPLPCTLYHMIWECQSSPSLTPHPRQTYKQWAGQLTTSDLTTQRKLVARTGRTSEGQGYLDYEALHREGAPTLALSPVKVYSLPLPLSLPNVSYNFRHHRNFFLEPFFRTSVTLTLHIFPLPSPRKDDI